MDQARAARGKGRTSSLVLSVILPAFLLYYSSCSSISEQISVSANGSLYFKMKFKRDVA